MVHSVEWTTGWAGNLGKGQKTGALPEASGPLRRVDHWLGLEPGRRAEIRELCLELGQAHDNSFRKRQVVSK